MYSIYSYSICSHLCVTIKPGNDRVTQQSHDLLFLKLSVIYVTYTTIHWMWGKNLWDSIDENVHPSMYQCYFLASEHIGVSLQSRPCHPTSCPIHGFWSTWEEWSDCSATCGTGTRSRVRECVQPRYGGRKCVGYPASTVVCEGDPCTLGELHPHVYRNYMYSRSLAEIMVNSTLTLINLDIS